MWKLPPLNALRALETAARHLSFARAAEELGVTPTAISHQIRLLEEVTGQSLFRRRLRGGSGPDSNDSWYLRSARQGGRNPCAQRERSPALYSQICRPGLRCRAVEGSSPRCRWRSKTFLFVKVRPPRNPHGQPRCNRIPSGRRQTPAPAPYQSAFGRSSRSCMISIR